MPEIPQDGRLRTFDIQCAGCGRKLTVDETILRVPMECTSCGVPVDIDAYEPLVAFRNEVRARRRAAKKQARHDRVEGWADSLRLWRWRRAEEKFRRLAEWEAGGRQREAERGRREEAKREAMERQGIRLQRARAREVGVIGMVCLALLSVGSCIVGGVVLGNAESAFHEIEAGILWLIATVAFSALWIVHILVCTRNVILDMDERDEDRDAASLGRNNERRD
ncbi:MAG: hypothetical protein ABII12_03240 [Planctomycetota bacterium]